MKAERVPIPPVEKEVTITMTETEAGELKHLLMYGLTWSEDSGGSVAQKVYFAFDQLGGIEEKKGPPTSE